VSTEKIFSIISQFGFSLFALFAVLLFALAFSSYIKLATVLGILRVGLGSEGLPSVFVTGSLALALTALVMFPTINDALSAMDKVLSKQSVIDDHVRGQALAVGVEEWRKFVYQFSESSERQRFARLANKLQGVPVESSKGGENALERSWQVLAPAFLVSELKIAFRLGFTIFLPLLLIDLFVANLLLAIGYEQLSPHLIGFPLKILLFVMVDGWSLITGNLVATYAMTGA